MTILLALSWLAFATAAVCFLAAGGMWFRRALRHRRWTEAARRGNVPARPAALRLPLRAPAPPRPRVLARARSERTLHLEGEPSAIIEALTAPHRISRRQP